MPGGHARAFLVADTGHQNKINLSGRQCPREPVPGLLMLV